MKASIINLINQIKATIEVCEIVELFDTNIIESYSNSVNKNKSELLHHQAQVVEALSAAFEAKAHNMPVSMATLLRSNIYILAAIVYRMTDGSTMENYLVKYGNGKPPDDGAEGEAYLLKILSKDGNGFNNLDLEDDDDDDFDEEIDSDDAGEFELNNKEKELMADLQSKIEDYLTENSEDDVDDEYIEIVLSKAMQNVIFTMMSQIMIYYEDNKMPAWFLINEYEDLKEILTEAFRNTDIALIHKKYFTLPDETESYLKLIKKNKVSEKEVEDILRNVAKEIQEEFELDSFENEHSNNFKKLILMGIDEEMAKSTVLSKVEIITQETLVTLAELTKFVQAHPDNIDKIAHLLRLTDGITNSFMFNFGALYCNHINISETFDEAFNNQ
jgi:hypothetical protein